LEEALQYAVRLVTLKEMAVHRTVHLDEYSPNVEKSHLTFVYVRIKEMFGIP
jgi:hypothetical protein